MGFNGKIKSALPGDSGSKVFTSEELSFSYWDYVEDGFKYSTDMILKILAFPFYIIGWLRRN